MDFTHAKPFIKLFKLLNLGTVPSWRKPIEACGTMFHGGFRLSPTASES